MGAAWQQHCSAQLQSALPGEATSQNTHQGFHAQQMDVCFHPRYSVFRVQKKTAWRAIKSPWETMYVKVRQTSAFLLHFSPGSLGQARGSLCFLLMIKTLWGMFCRVTILAVTSGQQPWEHPTKPSAWRMAQLGLSWCQTKLWDVQGARCAVTPRKGALGHASAGEHSSCNKSSHGDRPALAGARQKTKASGKKQHQWPQVAAGSEHSPLSLWFHAAWSGRGDLEPSFRLVIRMLQPHFFACFFTFFPFTT